jgi:type IV secretory pathway VirB4 component
MTKEIKDWEIAEQLANEYLAARETNGSGNKAGDGDGNILDIYFHEVKYSIHGFKFTRANFNKTRKQAKTHGRIPILTCAIKTSNGTFDIVSALPTRTLGELLNTSLDDKVIDKIMNVIMTNKKISRILSLQELEDLQDSITTALRK